MLKLTSVLVLSALSLAAQAADLLTASAAPPAMSIGYVTEGAACPGPGATGFATSGLLLSCQSGVWVGSKLSKGTTYSISCDGCGTNSIGLGYHPVCVLSQMVMTTSSASYCNLDRSLAGNWLLTAYDPGSPDLQTEECHSVCLDY